ncbi:hypothetical protein PHYBOEH_003710 [Phytophthora boehmeriae]|uniref:Sulfatase N-terminal domain-containing protein n=1 Tax=Phytophthora boehmeriae TaxID=109152 RepID=A0A8T1WV02_9STRA|nr:hypothetical protein PHYBOEH_003710 [Phytophthora boehmeriae]
MERPGLLQRGPKQCDLPEPESQGLIGNDEDVDHDKKRTKLKSIKTLRIKTPADLWSRPWIGWGFVYMTTLVVFSSYRYIAFKDLFRMYSSKKDRISGLKVGGALALGFLEDFVCATYLAIVLWLFDVAKRTVCKQCKRRADKVFDVSEKRKYVTAWIFAGPATFFVSWLLFFVMMVPFASDLLLVRMRELRFKPEFVTYFIAERDYFSAAPISREEVIVGLVNAAALAIAATFFAVMRTWAPWTDLTRWNPVQEVSNFVVFSNTTDTTLENNSMDVADSASSVRLDIDEEVLDAASPSLLDSSFSDEDTAKLLPAKVDRTIHTPRHRRAADVAVILFGLFAFPALLVALCNACTPLIGYTALNASLNELFGHALQPHSKYSTLKTGQPWVETFIHETEEHTLFGNDSLYRRTTGFHGDLAFDIDINPEDPPNVVVIAVESFRYHDSRFIVGDDDPSNLFKGTDMTITPNFDKWAKRGVTFRNMWSSSPSSRTLESVLFAQIPYNNVAKTGVTGGKNDTALAGFPQLFTAKGYENYFTTGSMLDYDGWDIFLDTHGFDDIWSCYKMMRYAEDKYGFTSEMWDGDEARGFPWGIHDDVAFQVLGDLLVNKTRAQSERMAKAEPKNPLFLMHYTISSHEPFHRRPKWYDDAEKPDFSALYEGNFHEDYVRDYLEIRYFTDMELGKFMDRMKEEGVLDNTIVVILGDHGRAPEVPNSDTRAESVTRVPCTIIAEGRLGDSVGLVIDDAVEQYDLLNTMADITGVPEGGFLQDGVGRSLKRSVPFGERVVFSNNPSYKMSVVRGHKRLQYDSVTDSVLLHDVDMDHDMNNDLFPDLSPEDQEEWEIWRDNGRRIDAYFLKRWDQKCLLAANCTDS